MSPNRARLIPFLALLASCSALPSRREVSSDSPWIDLHAESVRHLRGYVSEAFPPPTWRATPNCFVLNSDGFGSDLMTRETFEDFELEFHYRLSEGGNSGVLFAVQTDGYYSFMSGPEVQLLDDARHPDGKDPLTSLGALYGLVAPSATAKARLRLGDWNEARLSVYRGQLRFAVNGILLNESSLAPDAMSSRIAKSKFKNWAGFYKTPRGHILFQDHGGTSEFCDVRLRAL